MNRTRLFLIVSLLSVLIGLLVVVGWVYELEILKCVFPGLPEMKFNSAICFIFLGVAVLAFINREGTINPWLFYIPLFFTLAISGLTLASYIFTFDNGIDQIFVTDKTAIHKGALFPGRIAHATTFCFFILSASLLVIHHKSRKLQETAQYGFHVVTLVSIIAILGYIFGIPHLYGFAFVTNMALHTSVLLFTISLTVAYLNPALGIVKVFSGQSSGAVMARDLFPKLCLFVIALGLLRIKLHRLGLVGVEFGTALLALSFVVVGLFLVLLTARRLNAVDRKRIQAENMLKKVNSSLEKQVQERTGSLKLALEELSREQQRQKQMVQEIQEYAIFMLDRFGNIESWNIGAQKIKGYTAEEAIGQNFTIFHTPEDIEKGLPHALLLEALRAGSSRHDGWRMRKDGSRFWAKVSITAIHNEEGEVVGFSKVTHDLTSTTKSARKINDLADRLLLATSASRIGIWEWDMINDSLIWDERMFVLYGMNRGTFQADFKAWENCLHPDDKHWVVEEIQQALLEKRELNQVFRIIFPDGTIRFIKSNAMVRLDEKGQAVQMMGTNMDVTLEKNTENALVASNEQGTRFIEAAPSAIAMFDTELCYLAASNKWLEDYGLTGKNIIGQSHYDIFPEIGDNWKEIHRKCLNGHIDRCDEALFERTDGTVQWISWDVRPWYKKTGVIGGLIMSTADITERKRNEEAYRK